MNPAFLAFAAPLAMLLPIGLSDGGSGTARMTAQESQKVSVAREAEAPEPVLTLSQSRSKPQVQNQVRIQQRVIIRVAPRAQAPRQDLLAQLPSGEIPSTYEERKMADCVEIKDIAGVQPGPDNRLILYLQDRRMVTAALERACRPRDFYSGFYIEHSDDGKLCISRDKLQSRSGASCEVQSLKRLVAVSN
jgi:hypothetical protein